jgi:hypothetical protein
MSYTAVRTSQNKVLKIIFATRKGKENKDGEI